MGLVISKLYGKKPPQKPVYCEHRPRTVSPGAKANGAAAEVGHLPEGKCPQCRQEQLAARKYRIRLIIGIFFPFALSALDVTIIASALPWIASDFNELSELNWIISAFNLCSATFIPFWGQMNDIFGRTATVEATLVLMMIGSALCTSAPLNAFPLLIFGRAIQGMAVAGINVSCRVIMADKVSLKENAKNNSIFALFGGLSYAIGPVVGGFLTEKTWRWCFGINLPVAAAGMLLVFVVLRPQLLGPQPLPPELVANEATNGIHHTNRFKARLATIDFGGQFLFLMGMGLVILALTWGGGRYAWSSAHVVPALAIGGILSLGFIYWQYLMAPGRYLSRRFPLQKPTIPWSLISQRNMALLFYINFATGMALTAVLYYVDIYFTYVKLYTASQAGIQLLYYTPGIGVGVYLAMFFCNVYPRQTFTPLFLGSFIEALGLTILTWALHHGHTPTIYGMMALTGAGTGLRFMPGSLHGVGFFPNNISSVIAMVGFAVPFGGTVCMTVMGTVFNNKAGSLIPQHSATLITDLPDAVKEKIQEGARNAIVWAFVSILPFMWLCVVAAAGLGNVNITKLRMVNAEGRADYGENADGRVFLWVCLRRALGRKREGLKGDKGVEKGEEKGAEKGAENEMLKEEVKVGDVT